MDTVRARLEALLQRSGMPWQRLDHRPIRTADDAAVVRGTPLEIGGKALLLRLRHSFGIVVLSGARRTDNRALRHQLDSPRPRFATREELLAVTGLEPGCVPPFGRPLFDVPLYVDDHTADTARIAFSLGSHTASAVMRTEDWLTIARPTAILPLSRR